VAEDVRGVKELTFVLTVFSELLLGGSFVLTLLAPGIRVWPPPSRRSWQYRYTWTLTIITFVGILTLGFIDQDSFVFDGRVLLAVGGTLIAVGSTFALWAVASLGWRSSLGLGGDLVTSGAYKHSRNPQYVGGIAFLAGYAIACDSLLAAIAVVLGVAVLALMPFIEEPWLRQRFGPEYEKYYSSRVPRFVGLSGRQRTGAPPG
jgi:protein-S-isoprenylcysteine O-methyltransferase Ste14